MAKKQQVTPRLSETQHPALYEVNARVLLNELSRREGKPITLETLPDSIIDWWTEMRFDAIWLMGVWKTGSIGERIAREAPELQQSYIAALPDFKKTDVLSSPYAVKEYTVAKSLGGNKGLQALRRRLEERGVGLILDFVSNHTARDHAWVKSHPEYYVTAENPRDGYFEVETAQGHRWIAHGRDPYFPGWTDTAQLNPLHSGARHAMIGTLQSISRLCDGVRCDMAMLVLGDTFEQTWRDNAKPPEGVMADGEFWLEAIRAVKSVRQDFLFIAEAYWEKEWRLQQLGFDFTYDKKLYDRLLKEGAGSVYDHLLAEMEFQKRSLRFIENHDEPRAAETLADTMWHFAAATIIATIPGMVMFHDGQLDGRRVKLPVQLGRRVEEDPSAEVRAFYRRLLTSICSPILQKGDWRLLPAKPAWQGNESWRNALAFWWHERFGGNRLAIINYAPNNMQCYIDLPLDLVEGSPLEFRDLMGSNVYVRERTGLQSRGMYFDLSGYGFHVFDVNPVNKPAY